MWWGVQLGFGPEYDERAYLKREVRGRRVARSLSERCPAILRCADGIPSKSVANGFIPPCQFALADRPPESDMLTVFAGNDPIAIEFDLHIGTKPILRTGVVLS